MGSQLTRWAGLDKIKNFFVEVYPSGVIGHSPSPIGRFKRKSPCCISGFSFWRSGPPNLTIDRTIFEMWLVLADSPKSVAARS